jgi:transketolase
VVPPSAPTELERRAIDVVRGLALDAPNAARSGHQGTAMALAPLAHVLWTRILRYDADDPGWPDRDRLILSAGHASILLYSYLFLTGYGLTLDDLRAFRQWGSATPGHPEALHTAGVEVTTGPLGQGFGNSVGMAVAERWLRARFGTELCDHFTYVICSDGDLMEGISHEAASLAGHLGLGRLTAVYDNNHITIDGPTSLTFSDDTAARFRAYGWHVQDLAESGEDLDALEQAIRRARDEEDRPSMILVRTHVGYPSPNHTDDPGAHGYVMKDDEIRATKAIMGIPDEPFWVPDDVLQLYRAAGTRGREARQAWEQRLEAFTQAKPAERDAYDACLAGTGLPGWAEKLPTFAAGESLATRVASERCLNAVIDLVPGIIAGGADLTGNTGTTIKGGSQQSRTNPGGRQIAFGVREHGMAASAVGMARHGGALPVVGTFFVFSDYMRPSVRLSALSQAKALFVYTHDSVGLGEDGPTHQPIEHLAGLRAMPGLAVLRPADANETAHAWRMVVERQGPSALVLTRQNVPVLEGTAQAATGVARGAYTLVETPDGDPDVILLATGSEVSVCVEAAALLEQEDIAARVVSMPCWEFFEAQSPEYQDQVLPADVPVLAVEAASPFGWERWADDVMGIERFGASAPGDEVLRRFGFTGTAVADRAKDLLDALASED